MWKNLWEFIAKYLFKTNNKALVIGMSVLNAVDGLLAEGEDCSGEGVDLFPIYIRRGGKKWTIQIHIKCEKEK